MFILSKLLQKLALSPVITYKTSSDIVYITYRADNVIITSSYANIIVTSLKSILRTTLLFSAWAGVFRFSSKTFNFTLVTMVPLFLFTFLVDYPIFGFWNITTWFTLIISHKLCNHIMCHWVILYILSTVLTWIFKPDSGICCVYWRALKMIKIWKFLIIKGVYKLDNIVWSFPESTNSTSLSIDLLNSC